MVQLNILSGKKAGTEWVARRFPFYIGRSAKDELTLDDDGVWERHVRMDLDSGNGVSSETARNALASVNGQRVVTRTDDGGATFRVLTEGLPQRQAYHLVYRHALDVTTGGQTLAMASGSAPTPVKSGIACRAICRRWQRCSLSSSRSRKTPALA